MAVPSYLGRFCPSYSGTISLAPSVSESSPKGNDFELSDRNGCRKSGVSRLRVVIAQSRPVRQNAPTRESL